MSSIGGLNGEVKGMGDQLLQSKQTLAAGAEDANWTGAAAEQFRAHASTRTNDIHNCVTLLDKAAGSIQQLAALVD